MAITLGPLHIYWYGIIIAAGALLGLILAIREGKRVGLPSDVFTDLILYAAPIGIICARLYYVAFEWDYYMDHPGEIIKIWNGGIAIYGALIGAVVTTVIFCRVRRFTFLESCRCLRAKRDSRSGNWALGQLHESGSAWRTDHACRT
ncbi:prolipoprotein diacylglyceryl transferase [Sporolactobacillus inulinus]|uniref:Prolipoprotein diacylglyceryl transferase n=1 Tax=Sporolactobacillus inulinus TaxID=2078 RepID=A0A4Y1ZE97_9BACL|nr:prolipoprotein diacylglyceryl transferase [Sporolactobacillus inulinus]